MKRGKTPCEVEQCETCMSLSAAMEGHRHNYSDAREGGVALKQLLWELACRGGSCWRSQLS